MWNLREQISSAANLIGIKYQELSFEETNKIKTNIAQKYTAGKKETPFWEYYTNKISIQHEEAWKWVSDFIRNTESILFFNTSDDKLAYVFLSGKDLVGILGEMYNVEFYVTNKDFEYLLTFNHHDFLIACGSAIDWLKSVEVV